MKWKMFFRKNLSEERLTGKMFCEKYKFLPKKLIFETAKITNLLKITAFLKDKFYNDCQESA